MYYDCKLKRFITDDEQRKNNIKFKDTIKVGKCAVCEKFYWCKKEKSMQGCTEFELNELDFCAELYKTQQKDAKK